MPPSRLTVSIDKLQYLADQELAYPSGQFADEWHYGTRSCFALGAAGDFISQYLLCQQKEHVPMKRRRGKTSRRANAVKIKDRAQNCSRHQFLFHSPI